MHSQHMTYQWAARPPYSNGAPRRLGEGVPPTVSAQSHQLKMGSLRGSSIKNWNATEKLHPHQQPPASEVRGLGQQAPLPPRSPQQYVLYSHPQQWPNPPLGSSVILDLARGGGALGGGWGAEIPRAAAMPIHALLGELSSHPFIIHSRSAENWQEAQTSYFRQPTLSVHLLGGGLRVLFPFYSPFEVLGFGQIQAMGTPW